ncbi:hypothetical protein [Paenibacillus marinisediminis]
MEKAVTYCNLIFFIAIISIYIYLLKKERKKLRTILLWLNEIKPNLNATILYLDYTSENYQEIDEILSKINRFNLLIIFKAPKWLTIVKRKKWTNHATYNSDAFDSNFYKPENSKNEIIIVDNKAIEKITEVSTWLKLLEQNNKITSVG